MKQVNVVYAERIAACGKKSSGNRSWNIHLSNGYDVFIDYDTACAIRNKNGEEFRLWELASHATGTHFSGWTKGTEHFSRMKVTKDKRLSELAAIALAYRRQHLPKIQGGLAYGYAY